MRKARGDAKLKRLPEARQREVAVFASNNTLDRTKAWLAQAGIRISTSAISGFLSWWHLRNQFKGCEADAITMIDLLRRKRPDLPEGDLQGFAAEFFQLQAIKQNDPQTFLAFASVRHRVMTDKARLDQSERELEFEKEKFRETIKSNIERGLDALFEEIKSRPQAVELFQRFKTVVTAGAEATG